MTSDIAAPNWRLRFEDRGDYLFAEVTGSQDSPAITLAYWRRIEAECVARGVNWLLVCDRLLGVPANQDEFRQLAQALKDGALADRRIAFHEPVTEHLQFVEYGEMAMREVGLTMRVFASERESELWLRYGQV